MTKQIYKTTTISAQLHKRFSQWRIASLALLILGMVSSAAFAQNAISGKVTDGKDGSVMPGVTVQLKGTNTGTQTDANGAYKLSNVPNNGILVFSFIGYAPQEIAVGNRNVIDIKMADDSKVLNEVVVIGYGTQKKKDLTGSITSISSHDFNQGLSVSPEQLVAGKVAGVQITTNSGAPGSGSTIRIRGGSSLNASNDPLIVIDGVPVDNNGISGSPNALSFINPNDIESFSILKDASAAAIYGSRAANGVILITTKKGAKGDALKVNFSTLFSVSQKIKNVDVLSADQFSTLVKSNGSDIDKSELGTANTNWQDLIYRTATSTDNNLSLTGSISKTVPFRASVGFINQDGILKTSNMQRTSASIGLSPKFFNDHLKVDINLKGAITDNRFANEGAIGAAVAFDPTQPVYSGKDAYGGYFEWLDPATGKPNTLATRNPLGLLEQKNDKSTVQRSIGNIQFDYKFHFLPDLRANLNLGYDISSSKGTVLTPATAAANYTQGGESYQYSQTKSNKLFEFYLNYVKDLRSINSRIDVIGGYSYQDFIRQNPVYPYNDASGTQIRAAQAPEIHTQNTILSFYGRAIYSLMDKYILTATLRDDGSSRFSPANRWGLFPSVAVAWKIGEESFLKNSNAFSDLKLRGGYGVTGQQDLPSSLSDYPYLARYTLSQTTAQYQFGNTFYQTFRAEGYDANLKWETTTTSNIGLDFALKTARISGSLDFYMKSTKDLLAVIPVPAGSNLTNQLLTNVGNMENKGVEFSLNYNPIHADKFNWDLGFNITYNESKITNLSKTQDPNAIGTLVGGIGGGVGNTIQVHSVGYAPYSFYVMQQVYDDKGKAIDGLYVDRNGDGKSTLDDRYRYKSPAPKVFLGFNSQISWSNWNAGFSLRSNIGNYVYNNVASGGGTYKFTNNQNTLLNLINLNGDTRFANNQYFSDYYIQNASFLKMDNIYLGYALGKIFGSKTASRLTASVQNVFTITKYTGLDPEVANGIDNNFYPRPRTYSLGLNIGF